MKSWEYSRLFLFLVMPSSLHISRKKETYPVSQPFLEYLAKYGRAIDMPISYNDLKRFDNTITLYDKHKNDSLWVTALYPQYETQTLFDGLKKIYSILKSGGDQSVHEHLNIERVDYCTFGNSNPFRIKIVNNYNDVYDYFYIKKPDASRILGLELEHILSPSRINYFSNQDTIVEEHIAGIPGDMFMANYLLKPDHDQKRIAKEFVKFNERCLVRLLGDMRAYNFVFDITPDFEEAQYRIRPIDFDQQSYEGRKNLYLPQFFKENKPLVTLVQELFNKEVIKQYQSEERTLIATRIKASEKQLRDLLASLKDEPLAPLDKITQLNKEISDFFEIPFTSATTMTEILRKLLQTISDRYEKTKKLTL